MHLVSGRYSSLLEAHAPLPARLGLRGVAKFPSKGYLAARGPLGCQAKPRGRFLVSIDRRPTLLVAIWVLWVLWVIWVIWVKCEFQRSKKM